MEQVGHASTEKGGAAVWLAAESYNVVNDIATAEGRTLKSVVDDAIALYVAEQIRARLRGSQWV